jgi:26S proteasome regulatory subunit N3
MSKVGVIHYARVVKVHQLHADTPEKKSLLSWVPEAPAPEQSMDIDSTPVSSKTAATPEPVPEGEIYLRLLILHHLLTSPATYSKALQLARETTEKMQTLSRRSMDPIAAKVWFAVERAYELGGELAEARP